MGFLWLNLFQSKQTCTEPGTHCKEDISAWKTCPSPIHICSLKDAMSAQVAGWPALSGTTNRSFRCKETKNLYIMAAATFSCLLMGWRSRWCCNPKHGDETMSAWKKCPLPIPICSLKDAMSAQVAGWPALSGTTNRSFRCKDTWSSHVFSWVEEAADVGKQGCNPKHGDANDVSVGTHVAKGTLTAASRLHLHGRCPQRLLQRGASCSRTGSGAHKAKHRRAGKGQEHASEHTWGGASHAASFATQRAAQERPSKRSSWSQNHRGVRCEYKLDRNNTLTPMYVLNWELSAKVTQVSHILRCSHVIKPNK